VATEKPVSTEPTEADRKRDLEADIRWAVQWVRDLGRSDDGDGTVLVAALRRALLAEATLKATVDVKSDSGRWTTCCELVMLPEMHRAMLNMAESHYLACGIYRTALQKIAMGEVRADLEARQALDEGEKVQSGKIPGEESRA
jgi:hypothetical protein